MADAAWWGPRRLGHGEILELRFPERKIAVVRRRGEWLVAESAAPGGGERPTAAIARDDGETPQGSLHRFAVSSPSELCTLHPVLAARPVIVRGKIPLEVPRGESATVYVSTPIWVRISAGEPPQALIDRPSRRLAGAWLGPSVGPGQASFGLEGRFYLRREDVPLGTHAAVTRVEVENRSDGNLSVTQLCTPAPNLALHLDGDGALWTDDVRIVHQADADAFLPAHRERGFRDGAGARLLTPAASPEAPSLAAAAVSLFGPVTSLLGLDRTP